MPAPNYVAQTLDRGLQVLEILAQRNEDMTMSDIASMLDVHRTIAHRLVQTLVSRGFVSKTSVGRYKLGTRLIWLSAATAGELRKVARPILSALSQELDETVHLVVLTDTNVLFIDAWESRKALRITSRVGRTLPAHTTSVGKVLLANLPQSELRDLYPNQRLDGLGPKSITSRTALFKELEQVKQQGFAISREESEAGAGSVGVAICDRGGTPRAALSVAIPLARMTAETLPKMIEAASRAARQVGELL